MKTIGICSDHAGYELKEYVRNWLEAKGWEYKDFGTYSTESCDYADFAIRWRWLLKPENVTQELPFAEAAKASA